MEKNCDVFVINKLYFVNILDFISTWILNFFTFLDYGWTWTHFEIFSTGPGSQNLTVRSSMIRTTVGNTHRFANSDDFAKLSSSSLSERNSIQTNYPRAPNLSGWFVVAPSIRGIDILCATQHWKSWRATSGWRQNVCRDFVGRK